jgi:hypothetical protein
MTWQIKELRGANMDINLASAKEVEWKQDKCPWNEADNTIEHMCAVKNVSICKFFRGIKKPDIVLCDYRKE